MWARFPSTGRSATANVSNTHLSTTALTVAKLSVNWKVKAPASSAEHGLIENLHMTSLRSMISTTKKRKTKMHRFLTSSIRRRWGTEIGWFSLIMTRLQGWKFLMRRLIGGLWRRTLGCQMQSVNTLNRWRRLKRIGAKKSTRRWMSISTLTPWWPTWSLMNKTKCLQFSNSARM